MTKTLSDAYNALVSSGTLTPDTAQTTALPEFDRVLVALTEEKPKRFGGLFAKAPDPIKGLYVWGGVGRGKSMLMDLFFDTVPLPEKRRVHFHAFMQEIQAGLHEARKTGVDDAILPVADKVAENLRLLCFDEMQITDIADAMIVGRLFERLFHHRVTIVCTSNRVPDDLYKDGLNRQLFLPFIDLLKDQMVIWELASDKDYRQDRLTGQDLYFHPANAEARQSIDAIFEGLTGGQATPLSIEVKGRQVEIPAFHNGVARASFWDLCGKPLGPADYLALVDHARVLILEKIPRLSSENYNEARRFVTLIDALYEGKVRLIASAADRPDRLYLEGEGSFEFERTASRLFEMQSADWGA